jgi:hypothetical protein
MRLSPRQVSGWIEGAGRGYERRDVGRKRDRAGPDPAPVSFSHKGAWPNVRFGPAPEGRNGHASLRPPRENCKVPRSSFHSAISLRGPLVDTDDAAPGGAGGMVQQGVQDRDVGAMLGADRITSERRKSCRRQDGISARRSSSCFSQFQPETGASVLPSRLRVGSTRTLAVGSAERCPVWPADTPQQDRAEE